MRSRVQIVLLISIAFLCAGVLFFRNSGTPVAGPQRDFTTQRLARNEDRMVTDIRTPSSRAIESARKRIASLRSLRGIVSVEGITRWRNGHVRKSSLKVHFTYWNPDRMIFEFVKAPLSFGFYADKDRAVTWPSRHPGTILSVEEAAQALAGVSSRSSIYVPGILLGIRFNSPRGFSPVGEVLTDLEKDVRMTGTEKRGNYECVVLEGRRSDATIIVWIDQTDGLVRRIVESIDESQQEWARAHGGGGITGNIVSSETSFDISDLEQDLPFTEDLERGSAALRE